MTNILSVTIFTRDNCPFSKKLKDYLLNRATPYNEVKLESQKDILHLFSVSGGIETPTVIISTNNDRKVVLKGWSETSKNLLESLLGL